MYWNTTLNKFKQYFKPNFEESDDENGGDDREEESDSESDEPKTKKAKVLDIVDEEEDEEADEQPTKKRRKLEPLLTMVSAKGDTILSSHKAFSKALSDRNTQEQTQMVVNLCRKITTGTDADRQQKLRALFQFTLLSLMSGDLAAEAALVPTLYTICEKCHAINDTMDILLAEFAQEQISLEFCRLFRVIVSLYSMSDYRNAIGLPAQVLAVKMLTKIRARNLNDLALGVYLCSLLAESVRLSGRFVPELFVFLQSVISLGLEPDERPKRVFPSFKLSRNVLEVADSHKLLDLTGEMNGSDIIYSAVKLGVHF